MLYEVKRGYVQHNRKVYKKGETFEGEQKDMMELLKSGFIEEKEERRQHEIAEEPEYEQEPETEKVDEEKNEKKSSGKPRGKRK